MDNSPQSPAARSLLESILECYRGSIDLWPSFDSSGLASDSKKRFDRLVRAVDMLLKHEPMDKVLGVAKVSRDQLGRLINKAMQLKPDKSSVWGLAAFAAFKSQALRARVNEFKTQVKPKAGYGGMFTWLLETHAAIEPGLIDFLIRQTRPNRIGEHVLHQEFLRLCCVEKIDESGYPFSTKTQARAPLNLWFKNSFLPRYAKKYVAREHGQAAATALGGSTDQPAPVPVPMVLGDWVMDEQTTDLFARLELNSIYGDVEYIDNLPRVPIIRLRTMDFEVQIAWRLVLTKQASSFDVLCLLWEAVSGPPKADAAIEGLDYEPGAGFLANSFEQLRWTVPRVLYLDNALSHLADLIQQVVTRLWGGEVRLGIPGTPKERAEVESSIRKHTHRVIQQLPATSGSHPRDAKRKTSAGSLDKKVPVPALVHALDCYFANENVCAADAAGGIAPFERVRRFLELGKLDLPSLPAHFRRAHWFSSPVARPVCCDLANGRAAHVNFMGSRYTSTLLRQHPGMRGQKLSLRPDYRNLQHVIAFDATGTEFGTLTAEGVWGKVPHDTRIKKLFLTHRKEGRLGKRADDQPLQMLFAFLTAGAKTNPALAVQLAYVVNYLTKNMTPELFKELMEDQEAAPAPVPPEWADALKAAEDAKAAAIKRATPVSLKAVPLSGLVPVVDVPRRSVRGQR